MRTIETANNSLAGQTVHQFEAAGLGKAPSRFLGVRVMVGPLPTADGGMVGAPGQPMGCCKYCGTGIKDCYFLRSADGREFYAGCDCIKKVGDAGLLRYVKAEEAAKRRAKAEAKRQVEWQRRAAVRGLECRDTELEEHAAKEARRVLRLAEGTNPHTQETMP